jgi:hypothetical protein
VKGDAQMHGLLFTGRTMKAFIESNIIGGMF